MDLSVYPETGEPSQTDLKQRSYTHTYLYLDIQTSQWRALGQAHLRFLLHTGSNLSRLFHHIWDTKINSCILIFSGDDRLTMINFLDAKQKHWNMKRTYLLLWTTIPVLLCYYFIFIFIFSFKIKIEVNLLVFSKTGSKISV